MPPVKIFISYQNKKEETARDLKTRLETDGFSCFLDKEIGVGKNWVRALEKAVEECDFLVLLMTPEYFDSAWTNLERTGVLTRDPGGDDTRFRPLMIRRCEDKIPGFLRTVQHLDATTTKAFRAAYPKLVNSMKTPLPEKPGKKPPPGPVTEDEIKTYKRAAESLHEYLPMAGFKALRIPIRVEEIYVSLRAVLHLTAAGDFCFGGSEEADKTLRGRRECDEISLPEAFAEIKNLDRRGVVILGDPGAGKTTHVKRLLLWLVRQEPEKIGLPAGMLPVFLPLRELTDLSGGIAPFIESQLNSPFLQMPPGFGERILERGNLLFLFDGLDEVFDPDHRGRISRWIEAAAVHYRDCRFVVTSRFAGYRDAARLDPRFLEMHIRPLSKTEADAFIRNWYTVVTKSLVRDSDRAAAVAEESAADLIDILTRPEFREQKVFAMTRNPLLLSNLCLVHHDRGRLPESRAHLYAECTDLLLQRWRESAGMSTRVTARDGRRVLQPVALDLHEKERTRASAADLTPVIEPALQAVRWPHGDAHAFLSVVRDESGLLTGWSEDTFGFMHLGFQEYLAAREIRRRAFENPGILTILAGRFGDDWWQEVILLMLAIEEDPNLFVPFMKQVVQKPAFADRPDLVDMLIEDAAEVSPAPFLEILEKSSAKDKKPWRRQAAALRILKRLDYDDLPELAARMQHHPAKEIRDWAAAYRREADRADVFVLPVTGGEMVRIPGGSFIMGSPKSEKGHHESEGPRRKVHVPEFYMGRYPVTNREYGLYLKANPKKEVPENWGDRRFKQPDQPVVGVSWDKVKEFIDWLNDQGAGGCRLPAEAEWEYACRAGTTTRFYTGDTDADLDRAGWYINNSGGRLHPVGEKEPNARGLYDMHGNVWEWVEDDWHGDYNGAPTDGSAWVDSPDRGSNRVLRGGSWINDARDCRSALRLNASPGNWGMDLGFRLACPSGQ